jgi:membrane-bound inhibitor of C-type lysozyme
MADPITRWLLACCFTLAGCAGLRDPLPRTYLCDGGRMAEVTYSGDTARVRITNDNFELTRVAAASGARYRGARGVLHTKDDEALLAVDGRELGPCQQVKPKS